MSSPFDNATTGSLIFAGLGFITAIFCVIYFGVKGSKGLSRGETVKVSLVVVIMMTFCTWMMWICIYFAQMYPIVTPIHRINEH